MNVQRCSKESQVKTVSGFRRDNAAFQNESTEQLAGSQSVLLIWMT